MAYTKLNWLNLGEEGAIPINKDNLNHMDEGISANDTAITNILGQIYPIGSIIIKDDDTDMSSWLGFTWSKVFAGKVLIGQDTTDTDFDTIGNTGGEKTHTLTKEEMPEHNHTIYSNDKSYASSGTGYWHLPSCIEGYSSGSKKDIYINNSATNSTGGGEAHNNLQPYQVVAYWKRTA